MTKRGHVVIAIGASAAISVAAWFVLVGMRDADRADRATPNAVQMPAAQVASGRALDPRGPDAAARVPAPPWSIAPNPGLPTLRGSENPPPREHLDQPTEQELEEIGAWIEQTKISFASAEEVALSELTLTEDERAGAMTAYETAATRVDALKRQGAAGRLVDEGEIAGLIRDIYDERDQQLAAILGAERFRALLRRVAELMGENGGFEPAQPK